MPDYTPNFSGVIDALKWIIQNGIPSGGGGSGGGATAAEIKNAIETATNLDTVEGKLLDVFSEVDSLNTKLPSELTGDRIKTNTIGASLDFSGNASANNTDAIASTNISDYSWVTFQLSGTWVATVQAQFSDDNAIWVSSYFYISSNGLTAISTASIGLFSIAKQGEYFRLRVVAYTSGTIVGIAHASNNAPAIIPIQTVAFNGTQTVALSSNSVDTEFAAAIALNESLTFPSSPVAATANYGYNTSNTWDRLRTAGTAAPGLGRSFVAPGTGIITLLNAVSATGVGSSINLYTTYRSVTIQLILASGILSTISYTIEGSISAAYWYTLVTGTDVTNGNALFIIDKPFIYLRANLTTLTGTSPIITIVAGATP